MEEERVWVEDRNWKRFQTPSPCRRLLARPRRACGKEAHYSFLRSNGWWAYCEEHITEYGRRIRDGRVEISVHPDSPAAQRGYV